MTATKSALGRFESSSNFCSYRKLLASTTICTGLLVPGSLALAGDLPTGGSVAAGDVSIGQSGGAMTVTQGSNKAIVNWTGFSIGAGNSVTFIQPGSTSAILNRVTGDTPSSIAGSLSANGRVYLINPNGIAITSSGTVKVGGGFVASSLDIDDEDFLDGNLSFRGNGASAPVRNDGVISIGRGGYAALIGGTVTNSGLVAVPLGKAGLASGEQVTLDLSGDGFLQVAVPTAAGAEGAGALIENSGRISAEGGTVVMSAATAREAARRAVNLSGVVEARSVSGRNGRIVIGGGSGGRVSVSGRVSTASVSGLDLASADAVPTLKPTGGSIEITGREIVLTGAELDASGAGGGGNIVVGGGFQGTGDLLHADTTTVDAATVIRADATEEGDGGDIVLWSDSLTRFSGLISARGMGNGEGGDAEVSGKAALAYEGFADLGSDKGSFGTLLLDPYNITISATGTNNSSGTVPTGEDSVITVATLEAALAGANVEIATGGSGSPGGQAGDITVADAVNWSSDAVLTLTAANDIFLNADLTATGQNAGLVLTPGGDYSIGNNTTVTLSGTNASLDIAGVSYTLIHSQADLEAINSLGLSGNYALAQDLDLTGTTYTDAVIGTRVNSSNVNPFTGTFAGLGHVIRNLTIDVGTGSTNGRVGLFGHTDGATLRDVGLEGGSVTGHHYVGMLAGQVENGTQVLNSYATGDVTSFTNEAGGLVGYSSNSTISNVYATGSVSGHSSVGGLIGKSVDSTIGSAHAAGTVAGELIVGGLIGNSYEDTISDVHATGDVTGTVRRVGGLIGWMQDGTISKAYATGNVRGDYYVGGLVGSSSESMLINVRATGDVSAESAVGGLVGQLVASSIETSKATGRVSGTTEVGGLLGENRDFNGRISQITKSSFDSVSTGQFSAIGDNQSSGVADIVDLSAPTPFDPGGVQVPPGQPNPGQLADGADADAGPGQAPGTALPAGDGKGPGGEDTGLVLSDPLLTTPVCTLGTTSVPCGSAQDNGNRS
ncbi:GLUG motif-containing protein [Roseibium aggregatum]|uniref:Filamentous hemagglutinin N-terminal domain-containing protein n=1 Tax=Roseibium aggregatum TaxID=187304 RepID=A0A939J5S7_9HYPH|nr:GLUG motif-containing protein [Roseibium aggregatum]MBN9672987.1 filamentous hemagglutinin N-terminal domain-containing protein [Roseibium aggregatum]